MDKLFQTLQDRRRPEDVAEMIRQQEPRLDLSPEEAAILDKPASQSMWNTLGTTTWMLETFFKPEAPNRQVHKGLELFRQTSTWSADECADPQRLETLLADLSSLIHKTPQASDFKLDRLNTEAREKAGLDISRRRYNKLFRFLRRFETKLKTFAREQRKYAFTRLGKSRLAIFIPWQDFSSDPNTAAFIAYYAARCSLRSEFTNTAQQRPYDEIADMLFQRLRARPQQTCWWAVAHVYPEPEVVAHLSDSQKVQLLGLWLDKLHDIAALLKEVWDKSQIARTTMIVRRGNDSSTWNNTASAWNRARDAWITLLYSLGMEEQLESLCLGKVLRLMAADVAHWHRVSGGGLEPDTQVWAELPLPWEVLAGTQTCTKSHVEAVCQRHGVDPHKKGWLSPPPAKPVARFRPTPELVHGITVANPELALALRRAGWFSGKTARPVDQAVEVQFDPQGSVTGTKPQV